MHPEIIPPKKLFLNFLHTALDKPHMRALLFVDRKQEQILSYRKILEDAMAFHGLLQKRQIAKGSIIPIVLGHSDWVLSCFIGTVLYGAIPTILPPLTSKQDPKIFRNSFEKLLQRLEPELIVTREEVKHSIPELDIPLIYIETLSSEHIDDSDVKNMISEYEHQDDKTIDGCNIAFLQHSSGTTGLKKGVMLSHDQITRQIELYRDAIRLCSGDIIASWLPLYHDMGLICSFLMPLDSNNTVIMMNPHEWVLQPTMLLDYMEKERATFAWLPNFAFHHIMRRDRKSSSRDLSHIQALISCSEPCRRESFKLFFKKYQHAGLKVETLQVSYAMAENVFAVTQTAPTQDFRQFHEDKADLYLSCGQPLQSITVQICNPETRQVLPEGEIGEIVIESPCLFSGYHKQPELNKIKLQDNRYYTSDLGILKNGELYVVGRTDDLLIVNGKNILAHEVEDILNNIEGTIAGRSIVYTTHDSRFGTDKLQILVETDVTTEAESLKATIISQVLSHTGVMVQRIGFVSRGYLVKSTSGKLSRKASIQKYQRE